jgi:hypothetical protein
MVISSKFRYWVHRYALRIMGGLFFSLGFIMALIDLDGGFMKWFPSLAMGLFILVFSLFSNRRFLEEVVDKGDYLLLRGSGQADLVKLDSIIAIRVMYLGNCGIPILHLRLDKRGVFGDEVFFYPLPGSIAGTSFWQKRNVIEDDLIRRIDKARREMRDENARSKTSVNDLLRGALE